jgi:hypothetical protein
MIIILRLAGMRITLTSNISLSFKNADISCIKICEAFLPLRIKCIQGAQYIFKFFS